MRPLNSLSVMLLEDEYLIALDAEQNLEAFGVKSVRVVNTLAGAAAIAEAGDVDVAILDLNINGEMSFEVAGMFRKKGIPIVLASGYELRDRFEPDLEGAAVHLRKPYTAEGLKNALEAALREPVAPSGPTTEIGTQQL
jgi:CheY-like chemotaxis protein